MVPRVSSPGRSFKGAGLYYLHDKDAATSERVAFTRTHNLPTADPHKAIGWMACTAMNAEQLKKEAGHAGGGRRAEKPVWTISLAWHPEQRPTETQMTEVGRSWLAARGLQEHQVLMVAHKDEAHPHLHLIVNLIHPTTGLLNKKAVSHSKLASSKWAEAMERDEGKIYCEQRVENNRQREEGKFVEYRDPELDLAAHITALYHAADSGKAFQSALKEAGFSLAQGKRLVLIDRDGKMHSISRQIKGVSAKAIRAKLADLELPDAGEARGSAGSRDVERAGGREKEAAAQQEKPAPVIDRDWQDRRWQEAIIDAAIKSEAARPAKGERPPRPPSLSTALNALQGRQLAELGHFYAESQDARDKVEARLEKTYGDFERKLKQDLAALEQKIEAAGPVRKAWLKLTKKLPRDPAAELDGMRGSLENIAWRKTEAREANEKKISERRQAIETRQAREKDELKSRLSPPPLLKTGPAPAAGGAEPPSPAPAQDRETYLKSVFERQQKIAKRPADRPGRDREKERDGPDFEP
jgi:hypothetical protein